MPAPRRRGLLQDVQDLFTFNRKVTHRVERSSPSKVNIKQDLGQTQTGSMPCVLLAQLGIPGAKSTGGKGVIQLSEAETLLSTKDPP